MAEPRYRPFLSVATGIPYLGVPPGQVDADDVEDLPPDAKIVEISKPYRGMKRLGEHRRIEDLQLCHFEDSWIAYLAPLPKLRILRLSFLKIETLPSFAPLTSLRVVVLYSARRLTSLEFLRGVPHLHSLCLSEAMAADDLEPVGTLTSLRELEIDGSLNKAKKALSLEPLGRLTKLRYLSLSVNVDRSVPAPLDPLASLQGLETLILGGHFKREDRAGLVSRLPKLKKIDV